MEKTIFIEFLPSVTRYINSLKKKKLDQCFLRLLGFFNITGAVSRLYPPTPPFSLKKKTKKKQKKKKKKKKKKNKKKPKKKTKKKQLDLPIANKIHLICPRDAGTRPGRHVK